MRHIWTVAKHAFREAARDRVLYGLAAFAAVFIFIDLFFAELALGNAFMIKSFGLAGVYIFALVVTVFLGASTISKEIERRTLYFVLSKPVSRTQFLLGKFFGLLAAVFLTVALMAAVYLVVVGLAGGGFDARGLAAIGLSMLEMALLTAMMIFFSAIVRPLTATIASVLLLFTGHLLPAVARDPSGYGAAGRVFLQALYYILPNLSKFDARGLAAHGADLPPQMFLAAAAYALAYGALLLFLAVGLFKRRDL